MSQRSPEFSGGRQAPLRPRLPILLSGLCLMWPVWWYGQSGSQSLFVYVSVCAAVAMLIPRSLPGSSRSIVWCGIAVLVGALVVNVDRIMPTDPRVDYLGIYRYDRAVTGILALALAALYFRPSRATMTMITMGGLPMLMLALARQEDPRETGRQAVMIWGTLALALAAGLVQRTTAPRSAGIAGVGRRELWGRLLSLLVVLSASVLLTKPLADFGSASRDRILNLLQIESLNRGGSADSLSLNSPPSDFGHKVGLVMVIRAPGMPGYLREAVYRVYARGHWMRKAVVQPLEPAKPPMVPPTGEGAMSYQIQPDGGEPVDAWSVHVPGSSSPAGFCLPGTAVTVSPLDGAVPTSDRDGTVMTDDGLPPRQFLVRVVPVPGSAAFPLPLLGVGGDRTDRTDQTDPSSRAVDSAEYLHLPSTLGEALTNWVAACDGLRAATTDAGAIDAVVRHFREHYRYRLGLVGEVGDPLIAFMNRQEGHCTLFASATALLLRAKGIPTRVVGGYLAHERHPWTGRWTVRERDAHAWCEVWDRQAGRWLLVDATPPAGVPGSQPPPGGLRLALEALFSGFREFADWLQAVNPLAVIARVGAGIAAGVRRYCLTMPGALVMAAVAMALVWRRQRRRRDRGAAMDSSARLRAELARQMQRLERRLVPAALRRHAAESWTAWQARVTPELPQARGAVLVRLLTEYQQLRYRPDIDPVDVRRWIEASRKPARRDHGGGSARSEDAD